MHLTTSPHRQSCVQDSVSPRQVGTIPPVAITLAAAFSLQEQEIYRPLHDSYIRKLARKLSSRRFVWDVGLFHRTVLQAAWLGFQPLLKGYGLGRDSHTIEGLVNARKAGATHYSLSKKNDVPMAAVVREAFKKRVLSGQVVYRRLHVSLKMLR